MWLWWSRLIFIPGVKQNAPPPQPIPAELVAANSWSEPPLAHAGQPFTAHFLCENRGGAASGSLVARLELDNGAQAAEVQVQSLGATQWVDIYWQFPGGLPKGDHWIYCYLDTKNAVTETNKINNVGYLGLVMT